MGRKPRWGIFGYDEVSNISEIWYHNGLSLYVPLFHELKPQGPLAALIPTSVLTIDSEKLSTVKKELLD